MVPTVRKNHVQTAPRMPTLSAVARTTRHLESKKKKPATEIGETGFAAIRRSDRHSGYCSSLFDFPVPHLRLYDEFDGVAPNESVVEKFGELPLR